MANVESNARRMVLIIDDEQDIRDVAALSLEITAGWKVLTASSAAVGLAIAEKQPLDAILMDFKMPVVDGPAALRILQSNPLTSGIPVVMLTAKSGRGLAGLGAAGVLLKPFDPLTLAEQVCNALGWKL